MTKANDIMNEEIVGYCHYCKEAVCVEGDHVYKNGDGIVKLYHINCWKQTNNIEDEVNFDN